MCSDLMSCAVCGGSVFERVCGCVAFGGGVLGMLSSELMVVLVPSNALVMSLSVSSYSSMCLVFRAVGMFVSTIFKDLK